MTFTNFMAFTKWGDPPSMVDQVSGNGDVMKAQHSSATPNQETSFFNTNVHLSFPGRWAPPRLLVATGEGKGGWRKIQRDFQGGPAVAA